MEIHAIVHHEAGGYWAEVPALPGCVTEADTLDELCANLQEAATGWIEMDIDRGSPVVSKLAQGTPVLPVVVRRLEFVV